MDILAGIIILAVAGVVGYYVFSGMWNSMNDEWRDEDEFERRRTIRQAEFDRHEKAVARRCLVDTWAETFPNRK